MIFMKTEIERKWLLSGVPSENPDEIYDISQYYLKSSGEKTHRVRECKNIYENRYTWTETIKIPNGTISNEESERFIKYDEFKDKSKEAYKVIHKQRKVYYINGYKWEIDTISGDIILCELEFVVDGEPSQENISEIMEVTIPPIISDLIIKEVSDDNGYSNFMLSEPI